MTELHYSLAEMVKRSGAKRRAVQLWSDGGVLESVATTDRAGTGNHRLYRVSELQLAAVLAPLASLGIPIGQLKQIATYMRPRLVTAAGMEWADLSDEAFAGTSFAPHDVSIWRAVWRGMRGKGDNYLSLVFTASGVLAVGTMDAGGTTSLDLRVVLPGSGKAARPGPTIISIDLTAALAGLTEA